MRTSHGSGVSAWAGKRYFNPEMERQCSRAGRGGGGPGCSMLGVLRSELSIRGSLTVSSWSRLPITSSLDPGSEDLWGIQPPAWSLAAPSRLCASSPSLRRQEHQAGPSQVAGQPCAHTRPRSVNKMQLSVCTDVIESCSSAYSSPPPTRCSAGNRLASEHSLAFPGLTSCPRLGSPLLCDAQFFRFGFFPLCLPR